MTLEEQIQDFLNFYNNNVPSPEHEPIRFQKYVDIYKYHKQRQADRKLQEFNGNGEVSNG